MKIRLLLRTLCALSVAVTSTAFAQQVSQMPIVTKARVLARPKFEQAVKGAKLYGSNVSPTEGCVLLGEITEAPEPGQWVEIPLNATRSYRWLKYEGAPGSRCRVAEVEFYAGDTKLQRYGAGLGSPLMNGHQAFDDNPNSFAEGYFPDGQWCAMDLGKKASPSEPRLAPGGYNVYPNPVKVTMTGPPDAVICYTLDGTEPVFRDGKPINGQIYKEPITIEKTSPILAIACVPGEAPSIMVDANYIIGEQKIVNTIHFGNSLTGITGLIGWQALTAGHRFNEKRYLQGGALTKMLWNAAFEPLGDPSDKQKWIDLYTTRIGHTIMYSLQQMQDSKTNWEKLWPTVTAVDHMTLQPRDFDIDEEAKYDILFMNLVREKAPDMQPWLYIEWVERDRKRPTDRAILPSPQMKTFPAQTWEESMSAMMVYGEDLQTKVCETYKGNKRPRIIPAALAMGKIHHMIEEGQFPGTNKDDFYPLLFSDTVHPNREGSFLVDCCWFAAFFGKSPEDLLRPLKTTLTPAQAKAMQKLAWDVIENYPDCGYYKEGKSPAGAPTMTPDDKAGKITSATRVSLKSNTEGAWFRYTLDGTEPTRTRGYIYCGVITVQPGMTVKAIAYKSGMADSKVTTVAY